MCSTTYLLEIFTEFYYVDGLLCTNITSKDHLVSSYDRGNTRWCLVLGTMLQAEVGLSTTSFRVFGPRGLDFGLSSFCASSCRIINYGSVLMMGASSTKHNY